MSASASRRLKVEVVPAERAHLLALAPRMREADRQEVLASSGCEPLEALERSWQASPVCWAGLVFPDDPQGKSDAAAWQDNCDAAAWHDGGGEGGAGGEVACVFGVGCADFLAGRGVPWLLASDLIERHPLAFLRRNRPYVARMLDLFPLLVNWVDARNTAAIRWLKWCGFRFPADPVPHGVLGLPFYRFEMSQMRRSDHV